MTKPIRIACSGSSFGGKSTLAAALGEQLHLGTILHSRPTAAANLMGYKAARDVVPKDTLAFQVQGLIEQIKAEAGMLARDGGVDYPSTCGQGRGRGGYQVHNPGFVADRCVLDFEAHFIAQASELDRWRFPEYTTLVSAHARNAYDLIIYMPSFKDVETEDNGVRHLKGHDAVEAALEPLFAKYGLQDVVMRLTTDGIENRVAEVLAELRYRGLIPDLKKAV
jgi:hypothetical protein